MRILFGLVTSGLVMTAVLIAIMADLTRLRLAIIVTLLAALAMFAWFGGFDLLAPGGLWLIVGHHLPESLLLVVVMGFSAFFLGRIWNNRNLGSLDLGHGLGQKEFERRCAAYLVSSGWALTSRTTVSGMMLARAEKAGVRFALMFVVVHGDFFELAHSVKTDRLGGLGRLVFVCYAAPLVSRPADAEQDWRTIQYPALAQLEQFTF